MVLTYISNAHPNTYDLGEILLGLFHFYGEYFNEQIHAVSALVLGGLAPRVLFSKFTLMAILLLCSPKNLKGRSW